MEFHIIAYTDTRTYANTSIVTHSADLIGCGQLDPTGAFGTCKAGEDPACSDEYIGDGICDEVCLRGTLRCGLDIYMNVG